VQVIGDRYEVIQLLGSGGVADVFRVRDRTRAGKTIALKRPRNAHLNASLHAEYCTLAEAQHPHLVSVFDYHADLGDGMPGYTLEEVGGQPADQVADDLGQSAVEPIAVALLRAVAHIHAQDLTHGDIHPFNILVGIENGSKARTVTSVKLLDLVPNRPTDAFGALPFMAPERITGTNSSPASDLFSVGVTLHRLLTGVLPFPNYPAQFDSARPKHSDKLGVWAPLVCSLLHKEPTMRPLRATDALASIAQFSGGEYPPITADSVRASLTSGSTLGLDEWLAPIVEWAHQVFDEGVRGVQVIEGVRGSGRTHIMRDIRRQLEVRPDIRVLHCDASVEDKPFNAIRILMRQLRDSDFTDVSAELRAAMSHLSAGAMATSDMGKTATQVADYTVDQLGQFLLQCSQQRPLALFIDELDRVDSDSRRVLETLIRWQRLRPHDVGTLWMCVSTSVSPPPQDTKESECIRHARIPAFSCIEPWVRRSFAGLIPAKALIDSTKRASSDIPAVMVRTLLNALENKWLVVHENSIGLTADAPQPLPVPDDEHGNLLMGLSSLPKQGLDILRYVASLPIPVPLSFLKTELTASNEAMTIVDQLCHRRLLQWDNCGGENVVRVPSPSLADAIVERLGALSTNHSLDAKRVDENTPLMSRIAVFVAAFCTDPKNETHLLSVASDMIGLGLSADLLTLFKRVPESERSPTMHRYSGDALAALGQIEAAAQAYEHLETKEKMQYQAVLYCRHGRFAEAVDLLQESRSSDAETLRWLALAQLKLGNHSAAHKLCSKARASAKVPLLHARLDYIEGLSLFYGGQYAEARAFLERASDVFDREHRRTEEAETLVAHGLVYSRENDMFRAMQSFEQAMAIATQCGDRHRVMNTLMNLAVIHQERGEYELADVRYREAHDMAYIMDHAAGQMQSGFNLGNLNRFLGRLDRAKSFITQSISLAQESGNRYVEAAATSVSGEIDWLQGDVNSACQQLQTAVSLLETLGSPRELADALLSLAKAQFDAHNINKAQQSVDRSRLIAEEHGLRDMLVRAHLLLGDIARKQEDGPRALDHSAAVAELHQPGGRPEMEWLVQYGLHKTHREFGVDADAQLHGEKALLAIESVANGLSHDLRKSFLALQDRAVLVEELSNLPAPVIESEKADETEEGMQHSRQLSRLLDINRRLTSELNLERLLEYIIDSAILLTDAERGFILLAEESGEEQPGSVDVAVARNIDRENIRKKKDKVSHSIAQNVLIEGEAVLTTDAMEDERYNQYRSIHAMKLRSVMCLPMMVKGQAIGALYLDNRFQQGAFSEQDLSYMEAFASQASIAISNARLLAEREVTLTELSQSRLEIETLNKQLEQELAEKALALETSERVIVAQGKQLGRVHGYENIIGQSPKISTVIHTLDRVASSEVSVLVTGESGTGKELVARAVHYNGPRKSRPFVAINCSSIPENLIESELFGHVRGAFTGATRDRQGVFEVADGGTLFLDEIGDMPLEMQAKLLRALQDGQIQKVGSPATHTVDVRFIAATHRNLRDMVKQGSFREDLYYRLAVITLELPPLRDRKEDIPLLVKHFLQVNADDTKSHVKDIDTSALRLLMSYGWPGNVRELSMALKNACVFAETDTLIAEDFSNFPGISDSHRQPELLTASDTVQPLADLERQAIIRALEMNSGNKKRTAEQLGIDRRTLYNKLATYGISIERQAQLRGSETS